MLEKHKIKFCLSVGQTLDQNDGCPSAIFTPILCLCYQGAGGPSPKASKPWRSPDVGLTGGSELGEVGSVVTQISLLFRRRCPAVLRVVSTIFRKKLSKTERVLHYHCLFCLDT